MTLVVIGIDPHKGSHTAVAVDRDETELGGVRVRSSKKQCDMLLEWADRFGERRWAIESASGLGYLLAQQLVAAGEDVVDVPPTLSARVRVLDSTKASKSDPHDARSAAIVALRHRQLRTVTADDHAAILRMLANRHHALVDCAPRPCAGSTPSSPTSHQAVYLGLCRSNGRGSCSRPSTPTTGSRWNASTRRSSCSTM